MTSFIIHFIKYLQKMSWDDFEVTEVKTAIQCCTDTAPDSIARKPKCQASYGLIAFTDSSLVTKLLVAAMSFLSTSSRQFSSTYSVHEIWISTVMKEHSQQFKENALSLLCHQLAKQGSFLPAWTITGHLTKPVRWTELKKPTLCSYSLKGGIVQGSKVGGT